MGTYSAKKEDVVRKWFVVDASGKTLGRLASAVASVLKGKTKPIYTSHVDTGDFVIVVNAGRVKLTGDKWDQKRYYRHSGDPGHLKHEVAWELRDHRPERLVKYAAVMNDRGRAAARTSRWCRGVYGNMIPSWRFPGAAAAATCPSAA